MKIPRPVPELPPGYGLASETKDQPFGAGIDDGVISVTRHKRSGKPAGSPGIAAFQIDAKPAGSGTDTVNGAAVGKVAAASTITPPETGQSTMTRTCWPAAAG